MGWNQGAFRKAVSGLSQAAVATLTLVSFTTLAAIPQHRSDVWVMPKMQFGLHSDTFLNDTKYASPDSSTELRDDLFNPALARSLNQEYYDMTRDYDFREKYDQVDPWERQAMVDKNAKFSRYVIRHLVSYHITHSVDKAEKNSDEVRTFRKVQNTVQQVAQGTTSVAPSDNFKFGTKSDLPRQRMGFWMTSDVINGNADADYGHGGSFSPMDHQAMDPNYKAERYRFSVSRGLPIWSLKSAFTYGMTSKTVSTTVTKQLTKNLTWEFENRKVMTSDNPVLREQGEQTVKVFYGLSF